MSRSRGLLLPAFFLIFTLPLFSRTWQVGGPGGGFTAEVWAGWALLVAFIGVYLGAFDQLDFLPERVQHRAWWWLAAMVVVAGAFGALVNPVYVLWLMPYVPSVACYVLPRRAAAVFGVSVLAASAGYAYIFRDRPEAVIILVSIGAAFVLNMILSGMMLANERSAQAEAKLAVMSERDRLSQDLHDSLGHTLTVVSIKSELAQRMIDVDPQRSKDELSQMREQITTALAQVREVVTGMQTHDLATQFSALAKALADANIQMHSQGHPEQVSPALRPVFSWILREAGTNVLRHSGARRCDVQFSPDGMSIADDGKGGTQQGSWGAGLRGMHERAEKAGLDLYVGSLTQGGTRVAVARKKAQ